MPSSRNGTPTLTPPEATAASAGVAGNSAPVDVTDEQVAAKVGQSTPLDGPTALPPSLTAEAAEAVTATWHSGVLIDALWSIDETRNRWVRIAGVGWRKLYNGRDGSFQALSALAAQGHQTGRSVNLREEADGMIYEIYLW